MSEILCAPEPGTDHGAHPAVALPSLSASRWARRLLAFALVAGSFGALLAWTHIPTEVQADQCQILLAVDRLSLGLGPTTIYPRVPEVDWSFINHWPVGYPLLIWAVKSLTGLSTVAACQALNVAAFALALMGWTAWFRRCLPTSPTAALLAVTAGLLALVPKFLWGPSSDVLLVAATPLMLMWTDRLARPVRGPDHTAARSHTMSYALLGLATGALVWVRYTGLFLAFALALYLGANRLLLRSVRRRDLFAFGAGWLLPLLLLAAVNAIYAHAVIDEPASAFALRFDWAWFPTWWWHFTELPLFTGYWRSHAILAWIIPPAVALLVLSTKAARRAAASFLARPPVLLSICSIGGMLTLLMVYRLCAWSFFATPAEPRYLLPVRPFYLLLVVGPLLCLPYAWIRRLVWLPVLACAIWLVQAEWIDPLRGWAAEQRPVTAYGREARPFKSGADELYAWLRVHNAPNLIVFSNFFDDIALETHLPAQPLPADADELTTRVRRISRARNYPNPRVLFVLEPDNMWRRYFPDLPQAIRLFNLRRLDSSDPVLARYVFVPGCLGPNTSWALVPVSPPPITDGRPPPPTH